MPKLTEIMVDEKDEKYQSLKDDIKAAITEGVFQSRLMMYKTMWEVGERVRQDYPLVVDTTTSRGLITPLLTKLAIDTGIIKSELYRAVQFFDKFPKWHEVEKLPEGKNLSWHKIIKDYLPENKKDKKDKPEKEGSKDNGMLPSGKEGESSYVCPGLENCKPILAYKKQVETLEKEIVKMKETIENLKSEKKNKVKEKVHSKMNVMNFNFRRISDRFCELYLKKVGTKSSFTNWGGFNKMLIPKLSVRTEQEIYDGWDLFFSDKWIEENPGFDPMVYVSKLDKYTVKTKREPERIDFTRGIKKHG